jgi:hypothetical protein
MTEQTSSALQIKPLSASDHAPWRALWEGYQHFYQVALSAAVSDRTFARLLDEREPMQGALAWSEDRAVGLVHRSSIGRPGRRATTPTSRICTSMQAAGAAGSGAP